MPYSRPQGRNSQHTLIRPKGLLLAAIREPDPVIFFEPKAIYRASVGEVPEQDYELALGVAEAGPGGGRYHPAGMGGTDDPDS